MDENAPHANSTDRCISGLMYKSAGGFVAGAIVSFLVCKKKKWPMFIGTGVGSGTAVSHCIHMFRHEIDDAAEGVGLGCDLPEMFAKTKAAMAKK